MGFQTGVIFYKSVRGLALWTLFYPFRWVVQCLSWKWASNLGTTIATLHYLLVPDRLKRQVKDGIKIVRSDKLSEIDIDLIVRQNLVTRYKHIIDSFFYRRLDEDMVQQIIPKIEGMFYLEEAIRDGKGALLLMSHFGSFGLLIGGLILRGYNIHQVLTITPQPHYQTWKWAEDDVIKAKLNCWKHDRADLDFWHPGKYLRPLYRKLLQGEIIALYGDGARGSDFIMVEFMGQPLLISAGPFRIAARTKAALIPAFIIRDVNDTHRIILEKPIKINDYTPSSIEAAANRYSFILSNYVQKHPDHWFTWARLRWTNKNEKNCLEFFSENNEPNDFIRHERDVRREK